MFEQAISILICIMFTMILFFFGYFFFFKNNFWNKKYFWQLWRKKKITLSEYENFISSFAAALHRMSKDSVGALIIVEKFDNLQEYINLGYIVNSIFLPDFLYNIFYNKSSSLHDGGIIIRGLKIMSVSSYVPITTGEVISNYGSRHRAGIGISEKTDAIAFIISETTGAISYSQKGHIQIVEKQNINDLSIFLFNLLNYYL